MIQLLFSVIFAEMILILTFLFKTPFRKLVILTLDRVKRGSGPLVAKSVAATLFLVLLSSLYSMANIQRRSADAGLVNPTDQVLMARHLLEASLMGFILFLGLMIDRLHHYIRELRLLRKTMEATKKQNRAFEESKIGNSGESKALAEEMATLKKKIELLESECETKSEDAKAAEAAISSLKKQSEELLMEYDRLLEDNQNLRSQLRSLESDAR
uniref:Endoplasmic reticulum transmembrane protein n=1 Tax=Kalanchoe fedtschenkoi TaxID=63787 RepID=A0A7N0TTW3_KALFE